MHQSTNPSLSQTIWPRWASRQFVTLPIVKTLLSVTLGYSLSSEAVVMRQLRRWKGLWRRSLISSHKRTSMGLAEVVYYFSALSSLVWMQLVQRYIAIPRWKQVTSWSSKNFTVHMTSSLFPNWRPRKWNFSWGNWWESYGPTSDE